MTLEIPKNDIRCLVSLTGSRKRIDKNKGLRVVVPQKVYARMSALTMSAKSETSAFGTVYLRDNGELVDSGQEIFVENIFFIENRSSSASTQLDAEDLCRLQMRLDSAGIDLKYMRLWFHTHYNFDVFWSGTDNRTAVETLHNSKWTLSIVMNQRGEMRARVDVYNPTHQCYDYLPVYLSLDEPDERWERNCRRAIKKIGQHSFISPEFANKGNGELSPEFIEKMRSSGIIFDQSDVRKKEEGELTFEYSCSCGQDLIVKNSYTEFICIKCDKEYVSKDVKEELKKEQERKEKERIEEEEKKKIKDAEIREKIKDLQLVLYNKVQATISELRTIDEEYSKLKYTQLNEHGNFEEFQIEEQECRLANFSSYFIYPNKDWMESDIFKKRYSVLFETDHFTVYLRKSDQKNVENGLGFLVKNPISAKRIEEKTLFEGVKEGRFLRLSSKNYVFTLEDNKEAKSALDSVIFYDFEKQECVYSILEVRARRYFESEPPLEIFDNSELNKIARVYLSKKHGISVEEPKTLQQTNDLNIGFYQGLGEDEYPRYTKKELKRIYGGSSLAPRDYEGHPFFMGQGYGNFGSRETRSVVDTNPETRDIESVMLSL